MLRQAFGSAESSKVRGPLPDQFSRRRPYPCPHVESSPVKIACESTVPSTLRASFE